MNWFVSTAVKNASAVKRRASRGSALPILRATAVVLLVAGCGGRVTDGALVLTQTPAGSMAAGSPQDMLDQRYPAGSRVVVTLPPFRPGAVRVLSSGLVAAGGPVVCPDGKRIFFVGKTRVGDAWQIYETEPGGSRPKAITAMEGGAMDPAILANGDLVFSSPVPDVDPTRKAAKLPALHTQAPGGVPRRLTFGSAAAVAPTVLEDGRILFVSARSSATPAATPNLALFTVNNDGSEVTAFALDHDGVSLVLRPRELRDGRIGFLAMDHTTPEGEVWAETVRSARPFASRTKLFNFPVPRCRSVEPGEAGNLLASFETRRAADNTLEGSFAIYQIGTNATMLGLPFFNDPIWNNIEAIRIAARAAPMGHISALAPAKQTGTILCLNANFTRYHGTNGARIRPATRVRVLAGGGLGPVRALGEVPLQADGSFMAEVPADTPLGFESLDADGSVMHRLEPAFWVRPGENRSCLGCHEPYNRSARNLRPMAALFPPVLLSEKPLTVTQKSPPHAKE